MFLFYEVAVIPMSVLIGIAIDQGVIKGVQQPVSEFFQRDVEYVIKDGKVTVAVDD